MEMMGAMAEMGVTAVMAEMGVTAAMAETVAVAVGEAGADGH
jgi:hypothetical protein